MAEVSVNQREIWLCPFPFSDLTGKKVRPVLVLSGEACIISENVVDFVNLLW